MTKTPEELRPELLVAALAHIPFDGWSEVALAHAAADIGVSAEIARLAFPGGRRDLLTAWLDRGDARLDAALQDHDIASMKVRARIATAVRLWLEAAEGEREAVAAALRILALPGYRRLALRRLWRLADLIWRAAGDTATDYNHYTKRAILAGVLSATVLYWLNDHSDGHADSWAFLDRRINDVMRIEKLKAEAKQRRARMPSLSRFLGRLRYPAA